MSGWFGVRCLFDLTERDASGSRRYEERVTVWAAATLDEAIARAEDDARDYAKDIEGRYLGLAQAFAMSDQLTDGSEVFSLMRDSPLPPDDYLEHYFDSGSERQQHSD